MSRTSLLIGFLAGGWAATIAIVLLPALGVGPQLLPTARADDPPPATENEEPLLPIPFPDLGGTPESGNPTLPPRVSGRGLPNPGGGTSDSNHRAIALSASIGGGESAVYYFDTVAQRLLVYQYKGVLNGNRPLRPTDKGGLRLLAARHIDMDLRLQSYRDLSEQTRRDLKARWDRMFGEGKKGGAKPLPTKTVQGN